MSQLYPCVCMNYVVSRLCNVIVILLLVNDIFDNTDYISFCLMHANIQWTHKLLGSLCHERSIMYYNDHICHWLLKLWRDIHFWERKHIFMSMLANQILSAWKRGAPFLCTNCCSSCTSVLWLAIFLDSGYVGLCLNNTE